jgi:uroporphyrinogen-III synthase
MRLIVTRPADDLAPLQAKLEAMGHEVLAAPLLGIAFTETDIPAEAYQAVLITSANGARAIAHQRALTRIVRSDAITVGPASAAAAREAGFTHVEEAPGGDVGGVIAHVIATRDPAGGPLLYASGEITAGNLEESLAAHGFKVDRAVVYAAEPVAELPRQALTAIGDGTAHGVLLYSPRTANVWASLVKRANLTDRIQRLHHFCISANTAAAVGGALPHVPVSVASSPTEQGMLMIVAAGAA